MMTMPLEKSFRKCEGFKDDAANDKSILPTYVCTYAHTFIPIVSFFSAEVTKLELALHSSVSLK